MYLLDYGAGNVRSVRNAVAAAGVPLHTIETVADFDKADKLIFPGVGSFGACMARLHELGFVVHVLVWPLIVTHTHTHTHSHTHSLTHSLTHTLTHSRTQTCTHTHTQTHNLLSMTMIALKLHHFW